LSVAATPAAMDASMKLPPEQGSRAVALQCGGAAGTLCGWTV
jgi:hypothetical protein